jgi:hypothetical protein
MIMNELNATELVSLSTELMQSLEEAVDPERRQQEFDQRLEHFSSLTPSLQKLAKDDIDQARREIEAEQKRRAGEAQYALGRFVLDVEPTVNEAFTHVQRPMSAVDAWRLEHKGEAYSPDAKVVAELQVDVLDELRMARLDRELSTAPPSRVLALYNAALEGGDTALVRYVEGRHGAGWSGVASGVPAEGTAVQHLHRKIQATRDARVPEEVRTIRNTLASAKRLMQRMQDLHGVIARNPERQGA